MGVPGSLGTGSGKPSCSRDLVPHRAQVADKALDLQDHEAGLGEGLDGGYLSYEQGSMHWNPIPISLFVCLFSFCFFYTT